MKSIQKRALISVSDKTGVAEFAKALTELGYEIISTGGTADALTKAGIKNTQISQITGFPECLDGRVKTLHPAVHAGLLARRDNPEHMKKLKELNLGTIDVVAVNLYPFAETINKPHKFEDAVENIDIGGPTMLRSAAKNYKDVITAIESSDYNEIIDRLKNKTDDENFRLNLMYKVYRHTAVYDTMIADYIQAKTGLKSPQTVSIAFKKVQDLRYGENPHQKAAFYAEFNPPQGSLANAKQLWGKELSYLNINDAYGAVALVREFNQPAAVAVKHATPCGVALGKDVLEAYTKAYECDPKSIYGGIVALNRPVDEATAKELVKTFLEIVIAPDFSDAALDVLRVKENLRLLKLEGIDKPQPSYIDYKRVEGGLLIQDSDSVIYDECTAVTAVKPDKEQLKQLEFAYKVVKHVKSNAIVLCNNFAAVGIGGGQTNRVWAATEAVERAGLRCKGAVAASDAYFPFNDCVQLLADAGVSAIIQPGGSIRDKESIELCDKLRLGMVFTGVRHFKH